jgi:hypothetical protein
MFLSIEQRLHTSFDIFIPIRRSLQIEQKFKDREICSNSNFRIQSINKNIIKLYSEDNNMDPKPSPPEMSDLTVIEQQLISRISPCINVHLLNHGGIGSSYQHWDQAKGHLN